MKGRAATAPAEVGRVRLKLAAADVWALIWRPEFVPRWLGPHSWVSLAKGARIALADEAGPWRTAEVLTTRKSEVALEMQPAPGWAPSSPKTRSEISVIAIDSERCRLVVREAGLEADTEAEVRRYWRHRLKALADAVREVSERRRNPRQAVIVIHGIGEQLPGSTLRGLVHSSALTTADTPEWIKPDWTSRTFELRFATLKASHTEDLPRTDVFELYWAHLIRDTTLEQVTTWITELLLRWRVPSTLRPAWLAAWGLVLVAVVLAAAAALGVDGWWVAGGVLASSAAVAFRWGQAAAIDIAGDAARYLVPRPGNIARRQAIRDEGVELLRKLHESRDYDRIVVLGHSLGSVIAYDIITHAWVAMHTAHRRPDAPDFGPVGKLESALSGNAERPPQDLQWDAWRASRKNTQPWLISDLITVGSPLAHAAYLMAPSAHEFERAKLERTLPCCPPCPEMHEGQEKITFDKSYKRGHEERNATFKFLHHAAPFAITRWTNIFFKTRWLGLGGDLIGGAVNPQFGDWVTDVPLKSPWVGFAHTRYWKPGGDGEHLEAMRAALSLNRRHELLTLLRQIPPHEFASAQRGRKTRGHP